MIKTLRTTENRIPEPVNLAELDFPNPFYEGLQYNAPARGVWNIVHTGMLIPDSHQVYVCAQGCLRGVILTAAEMNSMERMSWVALRESDMWNGEMEKRVIEGTAHIVEQLNPKPRCVLIYLSCMHMFEGCDFQMITDELSEMYPDIDFVECYMIPTMRKTMSPDAMMKISLYENVKQLKIDDGFVGIIGNNLPMDPESDLVSLIKLSGRKVWDITDCKNYEDYLTLGSAGRLVSFLSVTDNAAKQLSGRLDRKWIKTLLRFDSKKLDESLILLGEELGLGKEQVEEFIETRKTKAIDALKEAASVIGDTEIAIDYTAYPYIIELAEVLLENGFNVTRLYADNFPADESDAFERLRSDERFKHIKIYPTNEPSMRFAAYKCATLAIGQKAAYFTQSPYFVDIVEGGGTFGYQSLEKLAGLMIEAYQNSKDIESVIGHKGWGCESCL